MISFLSFQIFKLFSYKLSVPIGGLSSVNNFGQWVTAVANILVASGFVYSAITAGIAIVKIVFENGSEQALTEAKKELFRSIQGVIILGLSGIVLNSINTKLMA